MVGPLLFALQSTQTNFLNFIFSVLFQVPEDPAGGHAPVQASSRVHQAATSR